jgi:hypothetical protein
MAGVVRDQAYLNWRYRRPDTRYQRYWIAKDQGYLVLKIYAGQEGPVLHICDLVVRRQALELVGGVLALVGNLARGSCATKVTAWLPSGHAYAPAFDAAGLTIQSNHDRFVFVTGSAMDLPLLLTPSHWHLTQGDSDIY